MLPKSERLTKEDFATTRPKVFFRGDLFDVSYIKTPTQKFACVISKKTLKRAVDRNKIKRRILSSLATIKTNFSESFIFYPKKVILKAPYSQINKEIHKVFATLQ